MRRKTSSHTRVVRQTTRAYLIGASRSELFALVRKIQPPHHRQRAKSHAEFGDTRCQPPVVSAEIGSDVGQWLLFFTLVFPPLSPSPFRLGLATSVLMRETASSITALCRSILENTTLGSGTGPTFCTLSQLVEDISCTLSLDLSPDFFLLFSLTGDCALSNRIHSSKKKKKGGNKDRSLARIKKHTHSET